MASELLLGTRKGLAILTERNGKWAVSCEAFPGIPVSHACQDTRAGKLWAGQDNGHWGVKLQRSGDRGASWDEIEAPKYPDGTTRHDGELASNTYVWLIQPGAADKPDELFIGTEPGGLFKSADGGETFELVDGLWSHESRTSGQWFGGGRDHPGLCSLIIDPRDSQHMWAGISVGGVFETTDGGETWLGRNKGLKACYLPNPSAEYGHDPHYIVSSPANPDVLWQQNHCGVFRSADGGQNWQDVSQEGGPAYFGFAIAVDEQDADTAWLIPAIDAEYRIPINRSLCVLRTEDGGQTWTEHRAGLPQDDCYDIAFRHALDVSGDRLAFGTTSGNIYFSEDRGDTWDCIAHNLATVYSVKFLQN
jgi:photosystem II stability/assembly factor-like uncharacterized protein